MRLIPRAARLAKENRLAAVGVAGPFVEHQHAQEIILIFHLRQCIIRQEIEDHGFRRVARIARTKLQAGLARRAGQSHLHHQFFGQANQILLPLRPPQMARRADPDVRPGWYQAVHSPGRGCAADCSGTSRRNSHRRYSASDAPARRPACGECAPQPGHGWLCYRRLAKAASEECLSEVTQIKGESKAEHAPV